MGLTSDINRQRVELTDLKEPILKPKDGRTSLVCSGTHHACFFLWLHAVSVCGGILPYLPGKKKPVQKLNAEQTAVKNSDLNFQLQP